jgi:ubiquinone/menaquinone biosynthesis C-methylase UbiE
MKNLIFTLGSFFLTLLVSFSLTFSQEKDFLTRSVEVQLNKRQPPDILLKTIGIKPGMIIGEVGAGYGRYTVHIASRIGNSGRIYANDIRQEALRFLEKRCKKHCLNNVETILGEPTDPRLPRATLDMVIMVNVVHCLEKPVALLKKIGPSLKPAGVIVIVEGNLDKTNPSDTVGWYRRSKLLQIYKDSGYILVREETFLPKDNIYFLVRDLGE